MNKRPFIMRILLFVTIVLFIVISGCGVEKIDSPPPVLAAIDVSPTDSTIAPGTTVQLRATGIFLNCCRRDITAEVVWTSSDPEIIAITETGLAVSAGLGRATLTATSGSISGTATMTSAMPKSLSVSPANPSIALNTTIQFAAIATFFDDSTQNLTPWVTWDSSDTAVATITEGGLATAVGSGTSDIRATFRSTHGTISGSTTLTSALPVSISLSPIDPSIALGTEQQFTATGIFADGSTQDLTDSVFWTSLSTSVATISNAAGSEGLASSKGVGETTIRADFEGVSGSTTLTVTAATTVLIEVTPTNPSIALGTDQQFTATGTFSDGSTQDVTSSAIWTSVDEGIATVSNATGSEGLATSVAEGSTEIIATFEGVSGSTILSVTPRELISISITPLDPVVNSNQIFSITFTAIGLYSDNSQQIITESVLWTSSDIGIASPNLNVSGSFFIISGASGQTNITATLDNVENFVVLTAVLF